MFTQFNNYAVINLDFFNQNFIQFQKKNYESYELSEICLKLFSELNMINGSDVNVAHAIN